MSKSKAPVVRDLFEESGIAAERGAVFIRTAYDGLSDSASNAYGVVFPHPDDEPFSAIQAQKDECDLNLIVDKNMLPGLMARYADRAEAGVYLDLASVPDFQAASALVAEANEAFDALPASVRVRFHNNPAELLAFLQDDSNRDEAIKLGLVVAATEVPPSPPSPPVKGDVTE